MSEPLTVVNKAPQVRALFAKFSRVKNPVVSEFTESIPEKFGDATNSVQSQKFLASDFVLHNRLMLKSFISKFHIEAGTLTGKVRNNIELLDDPTAKIIVSTHQPNLFAYGGVFKKIVMLETLKRVMEERNRDARIVNLFLVVDHDFVDESWMRLAQLPSIQHSSGIMELRMPVSESKRWLRVSQMPLPSQTIVHGWKRQVKSWIKKSAGVEADRNALLDNLEQLWQHVEASHAGAKSYADLNSFLMSRVVNETWDYSTLFVRLSEISKVFEDGFTFLLSNSDIYSDALRQAENMFMSEGIDTGVSPSSYLQAPLWIHCSCGSKASAKISNGSSMILAGSCMSCKKEIEMSIGNPDDLDISKFVNQLSPRAIPIPLLLARDLGISCYASGTGGIGYLMDGSLVSKKIGLSMPLVLVWPSRDAYRGIGQTEAAACMPAEDINQHLQLLERQNREYQEKVKPLLLQRAEKARSGEPLDDLLPEIFKLKEAQRRIRQQISIAEKIKNAIVLSPCFIDYAVNFGMVKTERTWRSHLISNGSLAAPVIF